MPEAWPTYGAGKPAAPVKVSPKWEMVTADTFCATHRLQVPGGWLYRVEVKHCKYGVGEVGNSMRLQFIADPEVKAQ